MSAAPIITIAWQQPAKWVGVEEHVRRGRIRNRGELTAGMVVQVTYKKGWYKATVINPDPLRTRNRTKKSCTCCASPTKHTHSIKGRERRRGSRGYQSSSEPVSESESLADGTRDVNGSINVDPKTSSETGLSAETDANQSEAEEQKQCPDDKKDTSDINADGRRNVFDLKLGKSEFDEASEAESEGGTAVKQQHLGIEGKTEFGAESETLTAESDSVMVSSTEDDGSIQGDVNDALKDSKKQIHDIKLHVEQKEEMVQDKNEKQDEGETQLQIIENADPEVITKTPKNTDEQEQILEKKSEIHQDQEQDAIEQIPVDGPSDQTPVGEASKQQAETNKEIPEQTQDKTKDTTVVAASEQIAKEHMYSQRMPSEDNTNEQVEMTDGEQNEPNQEQNGVITEETSGETGSSESEPPIQSNSEEQDKSEVVSADSETAVLSNTADVNVVYLRPIDINMNIDEDDDSQQSGKEQPATNEQQQNDESDEEEELECERFENGKRVGDSQTETPQNEGDQTQPMELAMAHPDEPLGQIKISEPVSLAGTINQQQEQPMKLTTGVQNQSPEKVKSSKHHSHGSKSSGEKPPEIRHKDKTKGLVAHQTTLPSGAPGPIILTMKNKKPKHKKSKKNKKHKDKDRERDRILSPQRLTQPAMPSLGVKKPTDPSHRVAVSQSNQSAKETPTRPPQMVARPPQMAARPPQMAARPPQMAARSPQAVGRQQTAAAQHPPQSITRQVKSPPSRSIPGNVMMPPNVMVSADGTMMHTVDPNVVISADGTMRHMADPIRHIEPPQAHMPPPQRGGAAHRGRNHSQSSQGSPTSPPNPQQQWYPVNMAHHPRMPGPPPGHPAHHMSPGDFANMRARFPHQPYHSGLPPYVEASFAGAPQHIRGSSQHPMSNAPNAAEAAYIRAQSLVARHCHPNHPHHPHWRPSGPPQFMPRDPQMHGGSVLRIPRYGHPHYQRMPGPGEFPPGAGRPQMPGDIPPGAGRPPMPGDIPSGAGRPPPLIPAPGTHPQRPVLPVSIHKLRPEGTHQSPRPGEMHGNASPNSITPRSSTSESLQSGSPPSAQKRPREPTPGELENILVQQFQENSEGERVIGVNELLDIRNALRRHHGFSEEPPSKSPRLDGLPHGMQPGMPCPPMLASIGLQPRPPSAPHLVEVAPGGQVIMSAVPGTASPSLQHPPNIAHPNRQQRGSPAQQLPHPVDGQAAGSPNVARHWVTEAQQLYPRTEATPSPSAANSANTPDQPTRTVPPTAGSSIAPSDSPIPLLAQLAPKTQSAGRSIQRSGRKQKNPHRRLTTDTDDIVVIKQEPLSPGDEAEECMDTASNDTDEQQQPHVLQIGSDSLDSITSEDGTAEVNRPSGSGPISQLQTLCTRLSTSRTPIIPSQSQSLQTAPPVHQRLTQASNQPIVHSQASNQPIVHSQASNQQFVHSQASHQQFVHSESIPSPRMFREIRPFPPMMQDAPESQQEPRVINPAASSHEPVPAAQPASPVELEPTSSGLTESAPSPDTSSASKIDKDTDVSRRLSFLEREMGIVKSWLWEIKTILTSRTGSLSRKGLPKCTDIGDGNVLIGAGEYSIAIARTDFLDCWDKTENSKDLVVKLISKVFTEEELAMSSFNGGMIRSTYKRRLADDPRFIAIVAQAEKEYGVANQEDKKMIREAVNNKCRKKAFKFRQQEAITQRISQQYQMYKE